MEVDAAIAAAKAGKGKATIAADLLDDGAALVMVGARAGAAGASLRGALAARGRERFLAARLPGAKWGRYEGCGTLVEGDADVRLIACGMGHVPPLGSRFLYLYTDDRS